MSESACRQRLRVSLEENFLCARRHLASFF